MTPEILPREETEAALEEVLAGPPFGQDSWAQALAERLVDWYRDTIGELAISSPILFWTTIVLLSILLAFLLWHVGVSLRAVWRAMRGGEVPSTARTDAARRDDLEPARAAMDRGEYRRAIELAWAAVAVTGEGSSTQTPRQQARRLAAEMTASLRPHLEDLLRMHEHACYAGVETSAQLARAAVQCAAVIAEAAPDA